MAIDLPRYFLILHCECPGVNYYDLLVIRINVVQWRESIAA